MERAGLEGERKNPEGAVAEYENALQLDPSLAARHQQMAVILFDQGKRDAAVAHWKQALAAANSPLEEILAAVMDRKMLPAVKADATRVMTANVRRDGGFRLAGLFRTLVRAGEVEWVVDVSRSASNPMELLGPLAADRAVPVQQREALYRRIIEGAEQQLAKSFGEARGQALATLAQWQMNYANYLLQSKQLD